VDLSQPFLLELRGRRHSFTFGEKSEKIQIAFFLGKTGGFRNLSVVCFAISRITVFGCTRFGVHNFPPAKKTPAHTMSPINIRPTV
jgi:hypothetical protein